MDKRRSSTECHEGASLGGHATAPRPPRPFSPSRSITTTPGSLTPRTPPPTPSEGVTQVEETELRIGQTNHQLDSLGFFKRHGSEGDDLRGQLERLRSQHAHVDGLYSRTVQEIRNERADNDPVAWIDRHADDIRYLEQELLVRDRRAERQLIAAAQIDPPDHITAVLGPRPENHAARPAWERGVAAIETYRHRHDIPPDHELSALGPAPSRTRPDPEFRDAERAVHQARTELGLADDTLRPERAAIPDRISEPPPRERALSRDHGLSIDL